MKVFPFLGLLLIIIPACSQSLSKEGPITFNLVPPLGDQSVYEIKGVVKTETKSEDSSHGQESFTISAKLETRVAASKLDGIWTLTGTTTTLSWKREGDSNESASEGVKHLENSFSVTMDRQGRILNIPENEEFGSVQRDFLIYRNPVMLLPTMMLPLEPVSVGASWPIDILLPIPDLRELTFKTTLVLKGSGTLKSIDRGQAFIDLTFTSELKMTSSDGKPMTRSGSEVMYIGKGTSSVAYGLKNARFTMNRLHITRETVGFAISDNEKDTKTIFEDSLQLNLVK
jgi:hypothetical protein